MFTRYSQKNPRRDSVEDDHLSFPPAILMLEASLEKFHKPSESTKKMNSHHMILLGSLRSLSLIIMSFY